MASRLVFTLPVRIEQIRRDRKGCLGSVLRNQLHLRERTLRPTQL